MSVPKASDFANTKVDPELVNPEYLRFIPDKFKVSGDGVFYTLQGEGITMGMPAVFVRLHVCNLQCVWCDSWYTWNKNTPEFWTEASNLTLEELHDKVMLEWGCEDKDMTPRIIFTGGEPMLQKDLITKFAEKYYEYTYEIETNGTIMPTPFMLETFQFNCSPKLENSKNIKDLRIKPSALIAINHVKSQFKFVVMSPNDLDEIERDFVHTGLVDKDKVILMPQGVSQGEVWENARNVAEYAKKKGYRLLGRLQTDVWGTRRRV